MATTLHDEHGPATTPARTYRDCLADLLLPRQCVGCGAWSTAVCPECASELDSGMRAVTGLPHAGELELRTLATYTGGVRRVILAWKNSDDAAVAAVMARLGRAAGSAWALSAAPSVLDVVRSGPGLLVVPAPSALRRRLRGRLVAAQWADAVAHGIASELGTTVLSADVLRRRWRSGSVHQAGASVRQRRRNRARPPRLLADVDGWAALLVDDVVTTGSTLGACQRALEDGGARCLGALTVAAAPSTDRDRVCLSELGALRESLGSASSLSAANRLAAGSQRAQSRRRDGREPGAQR